MRARVFPEHKAKPRTASKDANRKTPAAVELKPLGIEGVRVIGVALRCMACGFEWRGDLDPFLAVIPETAKCPRCAENTPPEAA